MMKSKTLIIALACMAVLAAVTPAVASAQADEDGTIDQLFQADDAGDVLETLRGIRDGFAGRASDTVAGFTADDSASDLAGEFKTEFNTHSADFENYANDRATADTSLDVLKLKFKQDDETASVYLTTDVSDGNFTNTQVVDTTDRTVDETCTLEGAAARNAADELDTFHDDYVSGNDNVTAEYLSTQASRYSGKVECSFSTEGL